MSEPTQEVINSMVIQNTADITKLKGAVFGNGERGLDEIVRTIETTLNLLVENKNEERKRKERFQDKIFLGIILSSAGIAITVIITAIRIYPLLTQIVDSLYK